MNMLQNPNRIPENYGLRIAAGLIAFFLLMKFTGFIHVIELRLLNLFILLTGVFFALRRFRDSHAHQLNYFRALVVGVATGAFASMIFAAFLLVYLSVIDPSLMDAIKTNEPMGRFLNPYMASFIVLLEGVFSGLLVTFILINYIQTDEVNLKQGEVN